MEKVRDVAKANQDCQERTSIALQVLPQTVSGSTAELIRIVDAVIAHIAASGYAYEVGPCETAVEGDFAGLMTLLAECQEICIREGALSVSSYIKLNYAPKGDFLSIDAKMAKYRAK